MTMKTYWAWETTATMCLLGGAQGAGAPTGKGEGRGHTVSPHTQLVIWTCGKSHIFPSATFNSETVLSFG